MSDSSIVDDELVNAARKLAPALRDRARRTEELRRIPDETVADLQAAGLFRVLQPARYGGVEADPATFADVVAALSAADASVGWVYSVLTVHRGAAHAVNQADFRLPGYGAQAFGLAPGFPH
jgi:alkylation response protein AidB-like acyl-CoA dehydrogenase